MSEILSVNKLLSRQLNIPNYQRPYKWTRKNVSDLFGDIDTAISDSRRPDYTDFKYRIGSIILHNNNGQYDIVDGQQRLITLSLINRQKLSQIQVFTENIAKESVVTFLQNNANYRQGVNTPHIILNYLDYLLWMERNSTKYKKLYFAQFTFEFRNSVEHWYPQHPSEQSFAKWDDVDRFGNLCIIQRNINSKFSNLSPASKKNTYSQMIEKGSLKLRLMSELTKDDARWKDNVCGEHEKEMLNLLRNACNMPIVP